MRRFSGYTPIYWRRALFSVYDMVSSTCGFIKINTDAAYELSSEVASLGMVARDDTGFVWLCANSSVENIQSL